jgi:hypothetical protein
MPTPTEKAARDTRRWKKELTLAGKREKDWQKETDKLVKRYRGEEKKRNRYNVLWANTEIFRAAYYNTKPAPDVRRRFRDSDPVGKAVAEVLERSLYFLVDGDEFDTAVKNDVLDALLGGRGISRVRYVPQMSSTGGVPLSIKHVPAESASTSEPEDGEEGEPTNQAGEVEQVEFEQVVIEHVDWRDFRQGYGRTEEEIPWKGFRHKLTQPDAINTFGREQIRGIVFAPPTTQDERKDEQAGEVEQVAEFWEMWDREGSRVFFLQEQADAMLYPKDSPAGEPPLELPGFFPCPASLRLVENTGSVLPVSPFHLYQEQAEELDRISQRIDRIVKVCRLRAIYDSRIEEIGELLTADDNELIPIQNAQAWAAAGGLDKAIAWMPIDKLREVLQALYDARERQKAIIDELSGVMDIMRGASDPTETYGAQQIKANYGSIRLKRPQDEVRRYARDLLRLASSVMCSKFAPPTFATMTDLQFPTAEQKQMLQQQVMMQQRQMMMPQGAPPSGMPPGTPGPPPGVGAAPAPPGPQIDPRVLQLPTWEDIIALMRSPAMRQFRIDVETDSTIAGSLESDMAGLSQLLKGVTDTMQGLAPMVMSGALPLDAAKEIVMAVIRRARLGSVVEDAFDKMQAPKPPPPQHDNAVQAAQAQGQAKVQVAQIDAASDQRLEGMRQQFETQRLQYADQQKAQREQFMEAMKTQRDDTRAQFDAAVKIIIATIQATKAADAAVQPAVEHDVLSGLQ